MSFVEHQNDLFDYIPQTKIVCPRIFKRKTMITNEVLTLKVLKYSYPKNNFLLSNVYILISKE
jgi:hypothetical protein